MVIVALSAAYTFTSSTPSGTSTSGTTISAIAFVHAALILFPTMAITLPKPSPQHLGTDIFTGFSAIVNVWMSLATLQFYPQYLELQRMSGSPGSLSLLSLEIRAVVTIAVAVRWFQRFGMPNWESGYAPLTMWYQWGWLPFNYVIEGISCALLLGMYLRAGQMGGRLNVAGEEMGLLA